MIPIPRATLADKARLGQLAEACATAAKLGQAETLAVNEAEIDEIVYRLFDLTTEEIALIESALAPTRSKTPSKRTLKAKNPVDVPFETLISPPAPETPELSTPTPKPSKVAKAAASSSPAWLPGELFALEGELTPAKKAKAARDAAQPVASPPKSPGRPAIPEKDELMATLRDVLAEEGPSERDALVRATARKLGYQRTGEVIATELHNAIRTAKRRGILEEGNGLLHADHTPLDQWDRTFLKTQFLAALSQHGRIWLERDAAAKALARWLGYRRTGSKIKETVQSIINGLIRENRIQKDGPHLIRRC